MFNSIFSGGVLAVWNVFLALFLALALGLIGALYYIRRNSATRSFGFTLALLPLITATVIMAVNGNLGAGIAVAGSFSLIRFRSAQGSGQEILALFLGAGYVAVACLLMVMCLGAHAALSAAGFGSAAEKQRELRITIPEDLDDEGLFDDLLESFFASCELIRVRTVEMGTAYQMTYRGTLRDEKDARKLMDAVRERNGNLPVSMSRVMDDRHEM